MVRVIYGDVIDGVTEIMSSISDVTYENLRIRHSLNCNVVFTARRNARVVRAVLATAIPSVCLSVRPSVRLSHAGVVSKRRHVARCSLHCQIAKCV